MKGLHSTEDANDKRVKPFELRTKKVQQKHT